MMNRYLCWHRRYFPFLCCKQ